MCQPASRTTPSWQGIAYRVRRSRQIQEVMLAHEIRHCGSHIHDVRSGPSCRSGVPRVPWPRDGTPLGATSVEVLETQRWIRLDDGQRGHGHSAISCANGLEGRGPFPWLPHTYGFYWTW